jgi:hypothetical protein
VPNSTVKFRLSADWLDRWDAVNLYESRAKFAELAIKNYNAKRFVVKSEKLEKTTGKEIITMSQSTGMEKYTDLQLRDIILSCVIWLEDQKSKLNVPAGEIEGLDFITDQSDPMLILINENYRLEKKLDTIREIVKKYNNKSTREIERALEEI